MASRVTDEQIRSIYRETVDGLYGYVSRRCGGDRDLAEDITQETWLRAVRDWSRKGVPESPIAWLTTVARNQLLNLLQKKQMVPLEIVTPDEMLNAIDDGRACESADIAAIVNRALARLPEAQSRLLEAFHYEKCRVAQIADSFGISERAVEGRLRRARESLRKELETALGADGGSKEKFRGRCAGNRGTYSMTAPDGDSG
jgi:RNA polymerase sigma-70 factor (ECF subfamily)